MVGLIGRLRATPLAREAKSAGAAPSARGGKALVGDPSYRRSVKVRLAAFKTPAEGEDVERVRLAAAQAEATKARLLAPDPSLPSILDETIEARNFTAPLKIDEQMNALRARLGFTDERLTNDEMLAYVRLGERVAQAIAESPKPNPPDNAPPVLMVNGERVTVTPTIELARALSWYLQAKAMKDNQSPDRDVTTPGKTGTLMVNDPEHKLFAFLDLCDQAYFRVSSHMQDETVGMPTIFGIPLHRGIEDFRNRMPGGSGTMLFVPLKGDVTLVKWERVGVPMPTRSHADSAEGPQPGRIFGALPRALNHGLNFSKKKAADRKGPDGAPSSAGGLRAPLPKVDRGENPKRGAFRPILDEYQKLMKDCQDTPEVANNYAHPNAIKREADFTEFHEIESVLAKMRESLDRRSRRNGYPKDHPVVAFLGRVKALETRMRAHGRAMGPVLAEERKRSANEVYCQLPVARPERAKASLGDTRRAST